MANKHKSFLNSLEIKEVHIKTTYNTTTLLPEWLKFGELTTQSVGEHAEHLNLLCIAGGGINKHNHFKKVIISTKVEQLYTL